MKPRHVYAAILAAILIAGSTTALLAQGSSSAVPPVAFSGVLFGNYQYHFEPGAGSANKFDLDRAYLTARATISERVSARITLDISPQQSGTGYVWRDKYAYLQYALDTTRSGMAAVVRAGVLHTVIIDHEEGFWPRWLGTVPVERWGLGSSADVGVSSLISLPRGHGELYAVISNGSGYTKPEQDRFKSFAARATWSPWGSLPKGLLKTFAISVWGDRNAAASGFVAGGAGQVGPVGDGLRRDRFGAFLGVRDPRLTVAMEATGRVDGSESGANTAAVPRQARDLHGALQSAYAIVRPLELADSASRSPLSIVARIDRYQPDGRSGMHAMFVDLGIALDLNASRKSQVGIDMQTQTADTGLAGVATSRVFAIRFVTAF